MTPTLHPTLAGLLRAVCENPADDDVRLVLADWYEENGQEERGTFIRIQCELARCEGPEPHDRPLSATGPELRRRERELAERYAQSWLWQELGGDGRVATSPTSLLVPPGLKGNVIDCSWRRGFPAFVSCWLVDWCGQKCQRCNGGLWACRDDPSDWCLTCHGTGRVNAHGPAIVQAAPVEEVTLLDREPYHTFVGWWGWTRRESSIVDGPAVLPALLFDCLIDPDIIAPPTAGYSTREKAVSALSRAALAWARQQPGLPALS